MANREYSGKVRARLRDGVVTVRALLSHPMETGSRRHPATGALVPRHFIQEVVCECNGRPVLRLEWGWGVAARPYVSFDLKEAKAGDRVVLRWVDNKGITGRISRRGQVAQGGEFQPLLALTARYKSESPAPWCAMGRRQANCRSEGWLAKACLERRLLPGSAHHWLVASVSGSLTGPGLKWVGGEQGLE